MSLKDVSPNPIQLFIHMITIQQKKKNNGYVVSGRIDSPTYHSMLGLIAAVGYSDVSSFVKHAVLNECKGIAKEMAWNKG